MNNIDTRRYISVKLARTLVRVETGEITKKNAIQTIEELMNLVEDMEDVVDVLRGEIKEINRLS